MYVLDTDHVSLLQRQIGAEAERLRFRLASVSKATTIITFEEQMRGWLAWLAQARSVSQQVDRYRRLRQMLNQYAEIWVLDFDDRAAEEFQRLQKLRIRIGTMDLKIAAIVLSRNALLLSKDLADFGQVPGLQVEDWTS